MIELKKPLSYSSLVRFIKEGWEGFINPTYKKSIAFEKGTIIDKLIFNEPFTEEIVDVKIPRPQIKTLIEEIINAKEEFTLEVITKYSELLDIKSKKFEKTFQEVFDNQDYINYFENNKNKFLKVNYDIAKSIADELRKDEDMMYYLSDGVAQFQHTFEYLGLPFLIKVDFLKVNDEDQEVIITDLKSSSFPPKFSDSIARYFYHIQGKLYTLGIQDWLEKNNKSHYIIRPFTWVVTSSLKPGITELNIMSYKDEIQAEYLIEEAVDNLKYALQNDGKVRETFEL